MKIRKLLQGLSLVLAASLGAAAIQSGLSYAAMWQWSTTASNNATADPSINWSEGMSPSSVNDSARAMMAVIASWRNDVGATPTTAGTSTAYTLSSNQGGFVANAAHNGMLIGFSAHTSNGAGAITINVDGAGAKPLRSATGVEIPAGALVSGSKYTAAYNSTSDEWLLQNRYGTLLEVPLGAIIAYSGDTAPNANFVMANGNCISRTTYAAYFALVGQRFGACDGVTTFGTPDLRGRFPGGNDEMPGAAAASRITNVGCISNFFNVVGLTCGNQQAFMTSTNQLVSHTHSVLDPGHTHTLAGTIVTGTAVFNNAAGGGVTTVPLGATNPTINSSFTGISLVATGSGSGIPKVDPSLVVNYLVRVL